MTWQTPDGDRWLMGAEAELFRESLGTAIDWIAESIALDRSDWTWDFKVDLFDALTPTQQLALANRIAVYLLTPTDESLELTAINEAAVYAVFQNVSTQIEIEIDTEDEDEARFDEEFAFYWRQLTLNTFHACFDDDEEDEALFEGEDPEAEWMTPQSKFSRNIEQWRSLVESLADRILWDRDFEMAGSFLDMEPAKATALKEMLGIESDHFSSIAPDLRNDKVDAMLKQVRELTRSKPR